MVMGVHFGAVIVAGAQRVAAACKGHCKADLRSGNGAASRIAAGFA